MLKILLERRERLLAETARHFSNHILKEESRALGSPLRSWYASNPRHDANWFRWIVAPGRVFLYGDVGTSVYNPNLDEELLSWYLGAAKDLDYLESRNEMAVAEFIPEAGFELLDQFAARDEESKDWADVARSVLKRRTSPIDEDDFVAAWTETGWNPEEISACYDWSQQTIFQLSAALWFAESLKTA